MGTGGGLHCLRSMTIVVTVESCKKEERGNVLVFRFSTALSTQALNLLARLHFWKVWLFFLRQAGRRVVKWRWLAATIE